MFTFVFLPLKSWLNRPDGVHTANEPSLAARY
jgi:hypothetical protein